MVLALSDDPYIITSLSLKLFFLPVFKHRSVTHFYIKAFVQGEMIFLVTSTDYTDCICLTLLIFFLATASMLGNWIQSWMHTIVSVNTSPLKSIDL